MNITQDLRRELADKAVDKVFKKKIDAAELAKKKIGDKIYAEQFAPYKATMAKLPGEAFHRESYMYIFRGKNDTVKIYMTQEAPVFSNGRYSGVEPRTVKTKALLETYLEAQKAVNVLTEKRRVLRTETIQTLASFRTSAQLTKRWPKFAKYLPAESTNLPALRLEDLNAALEL